MYQGALGRKRKNKIFTKNMKTSMYKDICTPMFTVALFTIDKTWNQPKHTSRDERIEKMW